MESALSGISVLLSFCDEQRIDLTDRFLRREFFSLSEMDVIYDYCQLDFGKRGIESTATVSPINSKARQKPTRKTGLASEYIRLSHIAK